MFYVELVLSLHAMRFQTHTLVLHLTWRFMGSYKWGYKWGNDSYNPY